MTRKRTRKLIAAPGVAPHTVTVFTVATTSGRYTRCQWRMHRRICTRSFPDTPAGRREAVAFAEGLADELRAPAQPVAITLGGLWARYTESEFDHLRPKSKINYAAHWRAWELFAGRETLAASVTRESLDRFRKELRRLKIAVSQVGHHVSAVKRVYRWGVERELIPPTKITDYRMKVAKEERKETTAEYTPAQALAILGVWHPERANDWRPWVLATLCHYCGPRANAAVRLEWSDYDAVAGTIRYRPELDKVGHDRVQPLPAQVIAALHVAWAWREAEGVTGRWIFYSPQARYRDVQPWDYSAFVQALRIAERKARVPHVYMNAAHRFRRGTMGNVYDATGGDVMAALSYIGDTDVRQIRRYLKKRDSRMVEVAKLISDGGIPRKEIRDT